MSHQLFHRYSYLFLLAMGLVGCALSSALIPISAALEDFGQPRTVALQMQLIRNNQPYTLESIVDISPTRLRFIATNMGIRLFTLDYDGHAITEGPGLGLPWGLPAQLIINDLSIILLDDQRLQKSLPPQWTLEQKDQKRIIYQNNKSVLEYSKNIDADGNGTIYLKRITPSYEVNVNILTLP